jgi:hypothetical protein
MFFCLGLSPTKWSNVTCFGIILICVRLHARDIHHLPKCTQYGSGSGHPPPSGMYSTCIGLGTPEMYSISSGAMLSIKTRSTDSLWIGRVLIKVGPSVGKQPTCLSDIVVQPPGCSTNYIVNDQSDFSHEIFDLAPTDPPSEMYSISTPLLAQQGPLLALRSVLTVSYFNSTPNTITHALPNGQM